MVFQCLPNSLSIKHVKLYYAGLKLMVNKINSITQAKLSMKSSFPRTSTLMKSTVSQLAKKNHPLQAGYSRWIFFFNFKILTKCHKSICITKIMVLQIPSVSLYLNSKDKGGIGKHKINYFLWQNKEFLCCYMSGSYIT